MFTKTRKIFTAIISLILTISMAAAPVYSIGADSRAVVEPDIEPQWQNTMATTVALSFDGSIIVISTDAVGYVGTTFSKGTVRLTKLSGGNLGTVKVWSGLSSSTNIFSFDNESLSATKYGHGLYRVNFTITATRNGVSEVVTGYKDAIY